MCCCITKVGDKSEGCMLWLCSDVYIHGIHRNGERHLERRYGGGGGGASGGGLDNILVGAKECDRNILRG